MDKARLSFIIRDFVNDELTQMEALLLQIAEEVLARLSGLHHALSPSPNSTANMKEVLDRNPEIMENLMEAVRRVGLEPVTHSIRGGTDGSRLSFMGLPCPPTSTPAATPTTRRSNGSARQDMETSVATIVELVKGSGKSAA